MLHAPGSWGVVSPVVVSSTKSEYWLWPGPCWTIPRWDGGIGQIWELCVRRLGAGRMTMRTSPSPVRPEFPPGEVEALDDDSGPMGTIGPGAGPLAPPRFELEGVESCWRIWACAARRF